MADLSQRRALGRMDPLSAEERLLVVSCAMVSIEGLASEPPRASLILAMESALPHLRADPDFAALATAVAGFLDALKGEGFLAAAKSRMDRALLAILQRDWNVAASEVQGRHTRGRA